MKRHPHVFAAWGLLGTGLVWFALLASFFSADAAAGATASTTLSATITPTVSVFLPMVVKGPQTDLQVSKTDGRADIGPGAALTYTILIANAGPEQVTSVSVTDTFPSALTGVTWQCRATSGSSCGALSGTGHISLTVSLTATGRITITAAGVVAASATGVLTNTVYVSAPPRFTDTNPGDNVATDTTVLITPPSDAAGWLAYVNYQRALARLPAMTENATWSDGARKHSIYMVKNNIISHSEDSTKPFYTPEGNQAAAASNVMVSSDANTTDNQAISIWMKGPFHAIGIIDPKLLQTGFGSFREDTNGGPGDWEMGATLDVIRGLASTVPSNIVYPIMWPSDGMAVNLLTYDGNESPDPRTHSTCQTFGVPTGLPIILQVGDGSAAPVVTASSFTRSDGQANDHCVFTELNYTNPDTNQQNLGRAVLSSRDAIVLIPRYPLQPGHTYTASITAGGQTYRWSFQTLASATSVQTSDPAPITIMR